MPDAFARCSGAPPLLRYAALRRRAVLACARLVAPSCALPPQPNFLYTKQVVSDDPYFTGGSLWGMYGSSTSPSNQFGTGAATAWASGATGSSDVYVGEDEAG